MKVKARSFFLEAMGMQRIDSIEKIDQGFSNQTYKVRVNDDFYKVRLGGHNDLISRKNEYLILKAIGDKDCLFYKLDNGNSVWRWIEGNPTDKKNIDRNYLDQLYLILKAIHSTDLKFCKSILNHDDLEFLEITKDHFHPSDLKLYEELVDKYSGDPRVLCHNDISLANLIYEPNRKRIFLIDYEWGRINNPYWDYGNFIKESDLSQEYIEYLSSIASLDIRKLMEYCFIATLYSLQLSYMFPQKDSLKAYRKRLNFQLDKYREWITE